MLLPRREKVSRHIATPLYHYSFTNYVLRTNQARHLVRMLRPELVRASSVPLSSDAFTFFGIVNARAHNSR